MSQVIFGIYFGPVAFAAVMTLAAIGADHGVWFECDYVKRVGFFAMCVIWPVTLPIALVFYGYRFARRVIEKAP